MAPSAITEDYYAVLEVEQTATPELITKSYKRLALKLHPDRNANHDATQAFQLLLRAYEKLKNAEERRAYDLIYPFLKRKVSAPSSQAPRPHPKTSPETDEQSDAKNIAALEKSKEERAARWQKKKAVFDSSIFEIQRRIRKLQQEIKNLDSIRAAEATVEASKNSWGTWLLSPIYKMPEESEEEKASREREKQERRIQRDMKERRLDQIQTELKREENLLRQAREEADAAIRCDEQKIHAIYDRIRAREARVRQQKERERLEAEKLQREKIAKIRRQQQEQREKQEREAAEARRKQQAEMLVAQRKRQEEEFKRRAQMAKEQAQRNREQAARSQHSAYCYSTEYTTSPCLHGGWWDKVHGRTACPDCADVWTYLLQCPSCPKQACPKCQAAIRQRRPRGAARMNYGAMPRARTPSPDYSYSYDWYD